MSEAQPTKSAERKGRPITYRVLPISGCHVCTSHATDVNGYPTLGRGGRAIRVVRYLYEEMNGPLTTNTVLRHECDNPACINLAHIIPGTHADNVADRVKRNRSARGTQNGRAKLNPRQVRAILRSRQTGMALARKYSVSPRLIKKIRDGELWAQALEKPTEPLLPFDL